MMRNIMYGARSNDLEKYCNYKNCEKKVLYNNLKTSTNYVTTNCRMRYSQYITTKSRVGKCTKLLDPKGNVVSQSE